jgi:hypothetical protein
MVLGFFGVVALPLDLVAQRPPISKYKTVIPNEAKRNEESQINSNKNMLA